MQLEVGRVGKVWAANCGFSDVTLKNKIKIIKIISSNQKGELKATRIQGVFSGQKRYYVVSVEQALQTIQVPFFCPNDKIENRLWILVNFNNKTENAF